MALEFTTAQDAVVKNGVKVLVYGKSGMGKTMLLATAPSPVLLSAESGSLSLAPQNLVRVWGEGRPDITYNMPIITIRTVDDLTAAYNWFMTDPNAQAFKTLGMDSLSEIAEVVLNNAKRQVKDPRQAYGELIEKMESVIRLFRDLPGRNVVMVAKQEPMKDELTGIVTYGPSMPGSKLGQKLPYFFDEVWRLGINKDQQGQEYRFLQTAPDLQFEAKDRSGALAPMEAPHLGAIFAKINGVV